MHRFLFVRLSDVTWPKPKTRKYIIHILLSLTVRNMIIGPRLHVACNSMMAIANCNSWVKSISCVTGRCALFNVKLHFYTCRIFLQGQQIDYIQSIPKEHLIPILLWTAGGRGAKNSHGPLCKWEFYTCLFSKRLQIIKRKKLSMYRIPIYIIDHVNFWPPPPGGAPKEL